jgi:hypothetical protein
MVWGGGGGARQPPTYFTEIICKRFCIHMMNENGLLGNKIMTLVFHSCNLMYVSFQEYVTLGVLDVYVFQCFPM